MMSSIHDRMPVLLPRETWEDWLGLEDQDSLGSGASSQRRRKWNRIRSLPSMGVSASTSKYPLKAERNPSMS